MILKTLDHYHQSLHILQCHQHIHSLVKSPQQAWGLSFQPWQGNRYHPLAASSVRYMHRVLLEWIDEYSTSFSKAQLTLIYRNIVELIQRSDATPGRLSFWRAGPRLGGRGKWALEMRSRFELSYIDVKWLNKTMKSVCRVHTYKHIGISVEFVYTISFGRWFEFFIKISLSSIVISCCFSRFQIRKYHSKSVTKNDVSKWLSLLSIWELGGWHLHESLLRAWSLAC